MAGETSKTNKLSAKLLFNINAISNNFIQTISISCRDLITAICRKQFEEIIGLRSVILCSFGLFDCYSAVSIVVEQKRSAEFPWYKFENSYYYYYICFTRTKPHKKNRHHHQDVVVNLGRLAITAGLLILLRFCCSLPFSSRLFSKSRKHDEAPEWKFIIRVFISLSQPRVDSRTSDRIPLMLATT